MTRINVIKPQWLLDQHLMAEYRELPMVVGSLRRSLKTPKLNIPSSYRMGTGHVSFFYNKKEYLSERWLALIAELNRRKFDINPQDRRIDFTLFDNVPCVQWKPSKRDVKINVERILQRVSEKPNFYFYKSRRMSFETYKERLLMRV